MGLEKRLRDAQARIAALEGALSAWDRFAAECHQRQVAVPLWAAALNEKAVELTRAALAGSPAEKSKSGGA